MKVPKLTLVATNLVLLLPIAAGLILWSQIPDRVPTHFNLHGEPDGWCGKSLGVVGFPLIILASNLFVQGALLVALWSASLSAKKKENLNSVSLIVNISLWILPIIFLLVQGMVLSSALGKSVNCFWLIPMIAGAVFVIFGNYMPKCRQNPVVGIRLPWTLVDEDNWAYTHRVGGWAWTVGGLLVMFFAFLEWLIACISVFVVMNVIPVAASYLYSRRVRNDVVPGGH